MLVRALPYRIGLARRRRADHYEREHAVERRRLAGALGWMLDHEVTAIAAGKSLRIGSSLLVVARRQQ